MKSGWKTSEFWLTALTIVGVVGTALAGTLPPKYAAAAAIAGTSAYAVARGLAKMFQDNKPEGPGL